MNIAKIVRITPDGAAFTTAHGTFYPFVVGMDDGHAGQANSKGNPPPWKVGEIVGYEVTGQSPRGQDKFKITRNPDPSMGTYYPPGGPTEDMPGDPPSEPYTAPTLRPPSQFTPAAVKPRSLPQIDRPEHSRLRVNLPNGATVGMAIKLAGDLQLANNPAFLSDEEWAVRLHGVASRIIAISRALENDTPLESNIHF